MVDSMGVLMLFFCGVFVINDYISWGDFATMNGLIWAINIPVRITGWVINEVQNFSARSEKIIDLLMSKPNIDSEKEIIRKDNYQGNVTFKNVTFKFEDEEILKDISFEAKKGQTIAFVGPTGSGKTTVINLMCRFYDATDGAILFDRYNIKNISARNLRNNIAVAMQDVFLFSDTIKSNISYGVKDVTDECIENAAKTAMAHGFILNMSDGYDTIIGEQGVGLSGGQKQRVSLARAIIKNTPILILDDTTSALDMETEMEIQKNLKKNFKEKTIFIIAHRISSVKNADKILVFDKGNVIEQGNHDELMNQNGYYAGVYNNQMGDFDYEGVK